MRKIRTFLLEGSIYCGKCGAPMTSHYSLIRGEYYFYYRCMTKEKGKLRTCDMRPIRAEQLEDMVVERMRSIAIDPKLLSVVIQEAQVTFEKGGLKPSGKTDTVSEEKGPGGLSGDASPESSHPKGVQDDIQGKQ